MYIIKGRDNCGRKLYLTIRGTWASSMTQAAYFSRHEAEAECRTIHNRNRLGDSDDAVSPSIVKAK